MVEIGLVTFVIALMAVVFMDDIPNSVKKQLYIKKHPEIKIFLDTYKQLNERRESDCEAIGYSKKLYARYQKKNTTNIFVKLSIK